MSAAYLNNFLRVAYEKYDPRKCISYIDTSKKQKCPREGILNTPLKMFCSDIT